MKRHRFDSLFRGTALMIVLSLLLLMTSCDKGLTAVTVRVQRFEGTVSLISNGKNATLMDNMLLHSGDSILTGQQSFIDMRLDDTKAVGLTQNSAADLIKSGKKLEVDVRKGEVYFYTTRKLEKDETFNLRSETLIVGIRGTSGYIKVDDRGHTMQFILTSGKVHVTGMNPTTGGRREADVRAGQMINVYLFNDKVGEDSVVFHLDDFGVEDLPLPLLSAIAGNEKLLDDVSDECGIPKQDILDALNGEKNDDGTGEDTGSTTPPTKPKTPGNSGNTEPSVPDDTPSGEDDFPPGEDDTPSVPDDTPSVPDDTPSVPDDTPSVPDDTPSVPDDTPSVLDDTPSGGIIPIEDETPSGGETSSMDDTPSGAVFPIGDDGPVVPGEE